MKLLVTHPAITEMLQRRGNGCDEYAAGVRAYLSDEVIAPTAPAERVRGYIDAHDMCSYVGQLAADLAAADDADAPRALPEAPGARQNPHQAR